MKQKLFQFIIALTTALIFLCGVWYYFQPRVVFHNSTVEVEIHETYDAVSFISKVKNGDIDDVTIEDETDIDSIGEYSIKYTIKNKTYTLTLKIVDTIAPIVVGKDAKGSIDFQPKPEDFIESIEDKTETTVSFKKYYKFDKVEVYDVIIVVEDASGNQTEINQKADILEPDTVPPTIHGLGTRSITYGDEVTLLTGISASDERDGEVEVVVIDDDGFSSIVPGTYTVIFEAKDKSDNTTSETSTFIVSPNDESKIIYMTFDDGPSRNTQAVLDILNQYNVKATFFVTGAFPDYYSLISQEHKDGHAIGLHTYSHKYGELYASVDAYFQDLNNISNIVYTQIGIHPKIIRFPGGGSNTISTKYSAGIMTTLSSLVQEKGYQYYDWNSENGDGRSGMSADAILNTAIETGGNKDKIMMLMHDGTGSDETIKALPNIIEHFKNKGYTFKTIDLGVSGYHHNINN